MRIALVVDNPLRDLPGMVLVATRLCELGATCYLVPMNLEWLEVGSLTPDFVLLTNLRGPKQRFARRLLEAGVRIGVLDCEGAVFPNLETYRLMASPDPDVYGQVSCFCSWGPKLAEYLRTNGWYRDAQLKVTGAPRFDYYADKWRSAALSNSTAIDRYPRPIVLITGSFPRANPGFQTPDQEIASWGALGFAREYMLQYQRVEAQAVRDLAAVANHVAARFPHATVVYRPHPFEKAATYEPLLERRENLHLLKLGTVDGWILRASVVIHRNSTTAIEAAIAGVPVLMPDWIEVGERLESVEAVSQPCNSWDELDRRLRECLRGDHTTCHPNGATGRIVTEWFHTIDGAAHERVASAILSHMNGGLRARQRQKCRDIHYDFGPATRSMASRAGTALRKGLGLPAAWSFKYCSERDQGHAWQHSEKQFDATAVRRLTTSLGVDESRLSVSRAAEKRDYSFGYRWGHSVVLRSVQAGRLL